MALTPYVYLFTQKSVSVCQRVQQAMLERWSEISALSLFVGNTFRKEIINQPNCLGWCGFLSVQEYHDAVIDSPRPVINFSNRLGPCQYALNMFVDDQEIGRIAGAYFLEKGYQSFAFIGQSGHHYSKDRAQAFRSFIQDHGKEVLEFNYPDPGPLNPTDFAQDRKRLVRSWLKKMQHPTAILAANDHTALIFHQNLYDAGLQLDTAHSIMGVDYSLNEEPDIRLRVLTSVNPDFNGLGKAIAETLLALINGSSPFTPGETRRISGARIIDAKTVDGSAIIDPFIIKLLQLIHSEIERGDAPRVEALAKALSTTPRTLLKRFDKARGISLREFILSERLNRAAKLLSETELNIADVAYSCGFSKQGALSSHFLKHYGCNPRDYRKRN